MRHILSSLAAIMLLAVAVASCDKMPDNGALDGYWQLMAVERGGVAESVKECKVFWSVRSNLVEFTSPSDTIFYAHFRRTGDTLTLTDICYGETNRTDGAHNEWVRADEARVLLPYGLAPTADLQTSRLTETFRIELLGGKEMLLSSEGRLLRFRKF